MILNISRIDGFMKSEKSKTLSLKKLPSSHKKKKANLQTQFRVYLKSSFSAETLIRRNKKIYFKIIFFTYLLRKS